MPRQTTIAKTGEIANRWHVVDAEGQILGRLAARIATILQGKHKPNYTAHVDSGDYVIVTNVGKLTLTGNKAENRFRMDYSRYPGGVRLRSYGELLQTVPDELLARAVKRMLPKGRLGRRMAKKLKMYPGSEHPHQAQNPAPLPM